MCLSCLACEAASCACCLGKGVLGCCGKAMPSVGGRPGYVAVFLFFSMLAWVLRGYATEMIQWIPDTALHKVCAQHGTSTSDIRDTCFSVMMVFRVSFALALFHTFLACLMIGVTRYNDCRTGVQEGGWLWKVLILLGMIVGSLWIPSGLFQVWGWIALVGAAIFIVIQLVLLVDFAHSWAESWIEKYEEDQMEADGNQKWWWALLSSSIVMYALSIAGTVMLYIWFVPEAECQISSMAITLNIVFAVLIAGISCHPKVQEANPRSGLLQAAIVTLYATYLIYSALMSQPVEKCNPFYKDMIAGDAQGNVTIALGAIFTIAAVCYSAIRSASQLDSDGQDDETKPLTAAVAEDEDDEEVGMAANPDRPVPYHFSRFHVIFVFGACYVGMLMSDWQTIDTAGKENVAVDMGRGAMWVKIISSWLCLLFYLWTLVAPLLFPDREWN